MIYHRFDSLIELKHIDVRTFESIVGWRGLK